MSQKLNASILDKARAAVAEIAGIGPPLVGLSMSPEAQARLRRECTPTQSAYIPPFGVSIIIDPRMKQNGATAFYDRKIWRKRVKEQVRWDRRTSKRNAKSAQPSPLKTP